MSRLKETEWKGIKGWQWDDGPIFVGEEGRQYAVECGKAVQVVEEWGKYAKLLQEQAVLKSRLEELKALRDEQILN